MSCRDVRPQTACQWASVKKYLPKEPRTQACIRHCNRFGVIISKLKQSSSKKGPKHSQQPTLTARTSLAHKTALGANYQLKVIPSLNQLSSQTWRRSTSGLLCASCCRPPPHTFPERQNNNTHCQIRSGMKIHIDPVIRINVWLPSLNP